MKKQTLSALVVKSFVTTMESAAEHQLMGGGRVDPVPTVASLPKEACKPVPTTNINWSGRLCQVGD